MPIGLGQSVNSGVMKDPGLPVASHMPHISLSPMISRKCANLHLLRQASVLGFNRPALTGPHIPQSKRLFIKDMAFFLFPSPGKDPSIARSFGQTAKEHLNPTMLPRKELENFYFTFLIRHPRLSIPSYYRLALPPHRVRSGVCKFDLRNL